MDPEHLINLFGPYALWGVAFIIFAECGLFALLPGDSLLFTVGKTLIGYYIGHSGIASTFGAAASLVVLLVWVYYSAQIFLLGAEFTRAYAVRYGSQRGRLEPAPNQQADVPVRPAA